MVRCRLISLALVVGCGADGQTLSLSEVSNRQLVTGVSARSNTMSVELRYTLPTSKHAGNGCAAVDPDTLHATLGGTSLPFAEFGSQENSLLGNNYCYVRFAGALADPTNGVAEVLDPSLDIVATFDQAALQARTASHPTWSFARGETVTLRWSHPGDLVGSDTFVEVSLAVGVPDFPVTISPPDGITFTVPADHPAGVVLAIVGIEPASNWMDTALSCENASSCHATQVRSYAHDANVY